jgi:hypothetical protein
MKTISSMNLSPPRCLTQSTQTIMIMLKMKMTLYDRCEFGEEARRGTLLSWAEEGTNRCCAYVDCKQMLQSDTSHWTLSHILSP